MRRGLGTSGSRDPWFCPLPSAGSLHVAAIRAAPGVPSGSPSTGWLCVQAGKPRAGQRGPCMCVCACVRCPPQRLCGELAAALEAHDGGRGGQSPREGRSGPDKRHSRCPRRHSGSLRSRCALASQGEPSLSFRLWGGAATVPSEQRASPPWGSPQSVCTKCGAGGAGCESPPTTYPPASALGPGLGAQSEPVAWGWRSGRGQCSGHSRTRGQRWAGPDVMTATSCSADEETEPRQPTCPRPRVY